MSCHKKFFFIFFVIFALSNSAASQTIEYKYIHKFSIKEGLSSYNIRKIIKDEFGYIWVATQEGLNRFDGNNFINYTSQAASPFRLPASDIRDLISDTSQHRLWVLTNVNGMFRINTVTGAVCENFKINYPDSDDWSRCFYKSGTKIWIGGLNSLKIFDIEKLEWLPDPQIPFVRKKNSAVLETGAIAEDKKKNLWVCINDYGIIIYNPVSTKVITHLNINSEGITPNEGIKFNSAVPVEDSSMAIGTNKGVHVFHVDADSVYRIKSTRYTLLTNISAPVYSLLTTGENELFVALDNALLLFNNSYTHFQSIRDKDGFSENRGWTGQAKSLYSDGRFIWIGSKEGLSYISKYSFGKEIYTSAIPAFSGLNHVYDIEPVNDHELLVGTKNGLYLLNRNTKQCMPVKKGITVNNLFLNFDGKIIVSGNSGNFIFNQKRLIPISRLYPELSAYQSTLWVSNAIVHDSIMLIACDDESGIICWNYRSKKTSIINSTSIPVKLGSNTINSLYMARDGKIWVLGDKVITILDDNINRSISFNLSVGDQHLGPFFDVSETNEFYWLCSYGNGLVQLDKNRKVIHVFNQSSGLSNDGVYKIFNGENNKFYITSNIGLTVFDNKQFLTTKVYEESGLHANTFEEAAGSSRNNEIFTGGPGGFSVMSTVQKDGNTDTPIVYINQVSVQKPGNVMRDTFSNMLTTISIPDSYIQSTIHFSCISYNNPARNTYAYKITELQNEWIQLGSQSFINLIGISPGTYHLKVQAFNENNISSPVKEIILVFLPKWFQTWWFNIVIILLSIFLLFVLYRVRIRQLQKEQQIRTKLAGDLHDDLGSTINSIKVYTDVALMETQKEKYLNKIKESTQEAMVGIRDMIWVLDDSKDTIEDLFARIHFFALPFCEANDVRFKIEMSDNSRWHKLGREEKRNLYMILKEAVNNSIKYSSSNAIYVSANAQKNKPVFQIQDNGKGFDISQTTAGNGLRNMKRRAKEIKYIIEINTGYGNGTTIRFQKT